jgi:ComF family protein
MLSRLRHWSQHLAARLPALLPCSCALCGTVSDAAICAGCHAQFFSTPQPRCPQCATPLAEINASKCGACLKQPPAFDATIVAVDYVPPADQLVLALKFGGRLALAPLFARMLCDALLRQRAQEIPLPAQLIAVPLGAQRLAERGFNQALEIAKPLSRLLGIRLDPYFVTRQRETQAQALLHPDERQRNIRHAFAPAEHAIDLISGRHIGVVDDVITTGQTLDELARTLKRFGAVRVTNFVFARTLQK